MDFRVEMEVRILSSPPNRGARQRPPQWATESFVDNAWGFGGQIDTKTPKRLRRRARKRIWWRPLSPGLEGHGSDKVAHASDCGTRTSANDDARTSAVLELSPNLLRVEET